MLNMIKVLQLVVICRYTKNDQLKVIVVLAVVTSAYVERNLQNGIVAS
jgi:hypothetical protein